MNIELEILACHKCSDKLRFLGDHKYLSRFDIDEADPKCDVCSVDIENDPDVNEITFKLKEVISFLLEKPF